MPRQLCDERTRRLRRYWDRYADRLGLDADLRVGDAQALDLSDAGFDTVVRTLSLCASPTNGARSPRRGECCGRPAGATGPRGRRPALGRDVTSRPVG